MTSPSERRLKPLHYYLGGTGAWYLSHGIQGVTFAWLLTIELQLEPDLVGIAQMALMLPALLLMLVGGSIADHFGGKPVAVATQAAAALGPVYLIVLLMVDGLSYVTIVGFALYAGCVQAIVTPARDGLLALVADGRLQRRVMQVSMAQWGLQMVGFVLASNADTIGPEPVLGVQVVVLLCGAFFLARLKLPMLATAPSAPTLRSLAAGVMEGFQTVRASPYMSAVALQNVAMGMFFMGTYMVTIPVLIRDVYDGTSAQLSWVNAANSGGLVLVVALLYRLGDVSRQGRALLASQLVAACALGSVGLGMPFAGAVAGICAWGMCGGITMTMSRTIMHEHAPADQRARIMAFYSFSFMGAGPIGALFNGYLVDWLGPQQAIVVSSSLMFLVIGIITLRSRLWSLEGHHGVKP